MSHSKSQRKEPYFTDKQKTYSCSSRKKKCHECKSKWSSNTIRKKILIWNPYTPDYLFFFFSVFLQVYGGFSATHVAYVHEQWESKLGDIQANNEESCANCAQFTVVRAERAFPLRAAEACNNTHCRPFRNSWRGLGGSMETFPHQLIVVGLSFWRLWELHIFFGHHHASKFLENNFNAIGVLPFR